VLALPAAVVFRQVRGPGGALVPAWKAIWPAFGASNQLLAALSLLVIFLWLRRNGRPTWFVAAPMAFMCITTLVALLQLSWLNLAEQGSPFVGVLSLVLSLLAMAVVADSIRTARARPPPPAAAAG
jgi:carbon starvation protein